MAIRFPFALFLILILGLPGQVFSQTCSNWTIEVCKSPQSYNTQQYGAASTCSTGGCYRVYYHFYLVRAGQQNPPYTTDSPFYFTNLTLLGNLAITPANSLVTGPGLSEVNVKESESCSTAGPGLNNSNISNSPSLNYDMQTNQFAYEISSNSSSSNLTYQVYGRMPLFVLAVDVFPGDAVSLSSLSYVFNLTNSSGGSPTTCTGTPSICDDGLDQTIAQPSTVCTSPQFTIGGVENVGINGFPNRKRLPVWVPTTNGASWNELDFLMSIIPGQNMLTPTVEGVLLTGDAVKLYPVGTDGQYRIYVHSGAVTVTGGSTASTGNTLFYIVFDGPQFESECTTTRVEFTGTASPATGYGRFTSASANCCKPRFGAAQTVVWDAEKCVTAHCTDVTLKAVHNTTTSTSTCTSVLYFDLYATSTQNVGLTDARCTIKVKKNGTFSLNTTYTYSPYCSSGLCISVDEISSDYLRITFDVSGLTGFTVYSSTPKLLATVALTTNNNGCISEMTFLDAVVFKSNASEACLTASQSEFSNTPTDDICATGYSFQVSAETESGAKIAGWNYYVDYKNPGSFSNCQYNGDSPDGTTVSRCVCQLTQTEQNVVLKKADNYLNGVTTFDLVLISKHILSIQFLSGFNLLASDANMSNTLTPLDIVDLRKLILGIYTSALPNANSWRFIDKDLKASIIGNSNPFATIGSISSYGTTSPLTIPAPNSFATEEFDEFVLPPSTSTSDKAKFVGFKVGDVSGNALPGFGQAPTDDRDVASLTLGTTAIKGRPGKNVEIPVFSLVQQSLIGWQMALQYDTSLLVIKGIRWPADLLYGQGRDWHVTQPGELRLLWFAAEGITALAPGTPLFFVQVELRQTLPRSQSLLQLASNSIPQEAYGEYFQQYAVRLESSEMPLSAISATPETILQARYRLSAYPNPSGANFRLEIEATQPAAARLGIYDLLGREVASRTLDLVPGLHTIGAAQLPTLVPGQYIVTLYTLTGVETLRLVKW